MGNVGSFFSDAWSDYGPGVIKFLIRLLTAILIYVIGSWIIRKIRGLVEKALLKGSKLEPTIAHFLASVVGFVLKFILFIIVLGQLGISTTSFVAIGASAIFALSFALQGSLANFAAGVMLLTFKPLKVGDWVVCADTEGTVKAIELFTTSIITPDGKRVIVPNGSITGGNIENRTLTGRIRVDMEVGIAYDDDVQLAFKTLEKIMEEDPLILDEPKPELWLGSLGDNAVIFYCRPWTKPSNYWATLFSFHKNVKLTFDKVGLNFPFPQRDVHMFVEKATPPAPAPVGGFDEVKRAEAAEAEAAAVRAEREERLALAKKKAEDAGKPFNDEDEEKAMAEIEAEEDNHDEPSLRSRNIRSESPLKGVATAYGESVHEEDDGSGAGAGGVV